MVGVVSSISSGSNFIFADFETPRCQFCTKMAELCYLGKTRTSRRPFTLGDKNGFDWQQWLCMILSLSSSVNSNVGNHTTYSWEHKMFTSLLPSVKSPQWLTNPYSCFSKKWVRSIKLNFKNAYLHWLQRQNLITIPWLLCTLADCASWDKIFFVLMHFFGKNGQIIGWHLLRKLLWHMLDPPLVYI